MTSVIRVSASQAQAGARKGAESGLGAMSGRGGTADEAATMQDTTSEVVFCIEMR